MKKDYNLLLVRTVCIFLALCTTGLAGTLSGKVSGGKGASVVYVEAIPGKTFPAPAAPFTMGQKGLTFRPHILAVPVGSSVSFLNNDDVDHNIFWPSVGGNKKQGHNLGTFPAGESRTYKYETAGVAPLLCNVHPEMSAYIIVVPTPYYVLTDDSGSYTLSNLPDGEYKVSAWHEGMKVQTKPIAVAGTASLDFALAK